jgi:hypothetical protein
MEFYCLSPNFGKGITMLQTGFFEQTCAAQFSAFEPFHKTSSVDAIAHFIGYAMQLTDPRQYHSGAFAKDIVWLRENRRCFIRLCEL